MSFAIITPPGTLGFAVLCARINQTVTRKIQRKMSGKILYARKDVGMGYQRKMQ
jgi:hypothetical protein